MRPALAIQTCGSLLLAFCLAPFQHVHSHDGHAEVHAHFYALFDSPDSDLDSDDGPPGVHIDHADDHASAKSLDNFTLAFAPSLAPFVLSRGQVIESVRLIAIAPATAVEACAHGPPAVDRSNPRAPPA